jgi:hypothetical protein
LIDLAEIEDVDAGERIVGAASTSGLSAFMPWGQLAGAAERA